MQRCCEQLSVAALRELTCSRCPQIGGLLLRLVMETALVKVPGKVGRACARLINAVLSSSAGAWRAGVQARVRAHVHL